jgi:hypothetical protein
MLEFGIAFTAGAICALGGAVAGGLWLRRRAARQMRETVRQAGRTMVGDVQVERERRRRGD